MGLTDHYGLERLVAGDALSKDGYKFTDADRVIVDRLLYAGAEGHVHTGAPAFAQAVPTIGLTLSSTAGSIPAGVRAYYKATLVDNKGAESLPGPETFVDMPAPVAEPAPPVLTLYAGGTLLPGNYFYVLSAYTNGVSTQETKALSPAYITIPVGSTNRSVLITYPTLPSGAAGWNIYAKRPGSSVYGFLASVPSGPAAYTDNGSVVCDCYRSTPVRNSTNGANTVTVVLGGGTPLVPVGFTWKVYRTFTPGAYANNLAHWVVEETSQGSGVITPRYQDMGLATFAGQPPSSSQNPASPSKVNLAAGAEVQNRLPLGLVQAFPVVITFAFVGTQMVVTGSNVWVCEYTRATIIGCRASLGVGYHPVAASLIVNVLKGSGTNPTPLTVYTTQSTRPSIPVGAQIGARTVPQVTSLVAGDSLTVNVDQVGGGATPLDKDLTVNVTLLVQMDSATSDMTWG